MKFFVFLLPLISFGNTKSVIVTYKYNKSPTSKTKSITFEEVQWAYTLTKEQAPYYHPSPQEFFKEFLRFKLGAEAALYEKSLVTNPNIETMIVNPFFKSSFQQEIYKALAEVKLKGRLNRLQEQTMALSDSQLKALYKKDSQYNYNYISIYHPLNPNPKQKKEAATRAKKIYAQVKKSKKPFTELVALTSDDKYGGLLNWNRTRASMLPQIYAVIKKMKEGSISRPIKVADGYVILKLNQKIPYDKRVHEKGLRNNYFANRKTKIFNAYMNGLRKHFKITFVNQNLIKTLK